MRRSNRTAMQPIGHMKQFVHAFDSHSPCPGGGRRPRRRTRPFRSHLHRPACCPVHRPIRQQQWAAAAPQALTTHQQLLQRFWRQLIHTRHWIATAVPNPALSQVLPVRPWSKGHMGPPPMQSYWRTLLHSTLLVLACCPARLPVSCLPCVAISGKVADTQVALLPG